MFRFRPIVRSVSLDTLSPRFFKFNKSEIERKIELERIITLQNQIDNLRNRVDRLENKEIKDETYAYCSPVSFDKEQDYEFKP